MLGKHEKKNTANLGRPTPWNLEDKNSQNWHLPQTKHPAAAINNPKMKAYGLDMYIQEHECTRAVW